MGIGLPQRAASADHLPTGGTADPLMALPAELLGLVGVPHTRASDDPPLGANRPPADFLSECAKARAGLAETCASRGGWPAEQKGGNFCQHSAEQCCRMSGAPVAVISPSFVGNEASAALIFPHLWLAGQHP
jgi:hypothetical protein